MSDQRNTTEGTASMLTMEKILEAQRRIEALGSMPMEIRETVSAVQRVQARVYPKRKAKNANHLRRMNNKWKRRYGFVDKPGAFLMDTSLLEMGIGMFGRRAPRVARQILFVHPDIMAMIKITESGSLGLGQP